MSSAGYRMKNISWDLRKVVDYSNIMDLNDFKGEVLAPSLDVPGRLGSIPTLSAKNLYKSLTSMRSRGGSFPRVTWQSSSKTWKTAASGIDFPIDVIEDNEAKKIFPLKKYGSKLLASMNTVRIENNIAAIYQTNANFSGGNIKDASETSLTSDNLRNIFMTDVKEYFRKKGISLRKLHVQMTEDYIEKLIAIDDISSKWESTKGDIRASSIEEKKNLVASYLGVEKVITTEAVKNSSGYLSSGDFIELFDSKKMTIFLPSKAGNNWDYSFCRTLNNTESVIGKSKFTIKDFYDESNEEEVIRLIFDDGLLANYELGFLIYDLTA